MPTDENPIAEISVGRTDLFLGIMVGRSADS